MKNFAIKACLFLSAVIFLVASILWLIPYPKNYGYSLIQGNDYAKVSWNYNRIFESDEPVDVALIGTSQSFYGLQDKLIQSILNERGGNKNVVNLAFPGLGRNQHYVVADDLLTHKQPSAIIIEVMEREKRDSHKAAVYMASNQQAAQFLTFHNLKLWRDLQGAYSSRKERFRDLLMGKEAPMAGERGLTMENSFKTVDRVFSRAEMEIRKKELENVMNPPLLSETFWRLEYGLPLSMIEKICSTARLKGVPCHFLYVARYGAPETPAPYFIDFYRKYGSVLIPPSTIWNNPSYYCDGHHLNRDGADALSRWVAGELAKEL
jgi:hypothetical protein